MELVGLGLMACSSGAKKDDENVAFAKQQKITQDFERANQMLDDGKSTEAAALYDRIVLENPTNPMQNMIIYNAGLAYLQGGNCPKAGDRFRQVIRLTNNKVPPLEGRALLGLSDIYTCLGQDTKAITTLVQISQGKYQLPEEVTAAEIPAKLAGAYARIGNVKEGERYYRIAEKGLSRLQSGLRENQRREDLSRTLFMMGNISQLNTKTMKSGDYFATVRALQKYLYKSVEMNSKTWSPQAFEMIMQAYRQTWDYIDEIHPEKGEDEAITNRAQKKSQIELAQTAIQSLRYLYQERIPNPDEPVSVKQLMERLRSEETRLRNFIATNIVGTGLTREAVEAQALKRSGRVLNPDPILERESLTRKAPLRTSRSLRTSPKKPEGAESASGE